MFKLIKKEHDDIAEFSTYTYINEKNFELKVTVWDDDIPEMVSRVHVYLKNIGIPIPGGPEISYAAGNLCFSIERPFSCEINELPELKKELDEFIKMGEEIKKIIEDMENEQYRDI